MKQKIISLTALILMLALAPAANAAPPDVSASKYESLGADFETDDRFIYVSADTFSETFSEDSLEARVCS